MNRSPYTKTVDEEICVIETEEWCLAFEGSFTHWGERGGTGVMLYAPDDIDISLTFKLKLFCTNRKVEYEALVIGLISGLKVGVRRLQCREIQGLSLSSPTTNCANKKSTLCLTRLPSKE